MNRADTLKRFLVLNGITTKGTPYPFVEEPVAVNKKDYKNLLSVQKKLNKIFSQETDYAFARKLTDQYVKELVNIYDGLKGENPIVLNFMRSDYILNSSGQYKQVEVNTFSIACVSLSQILSQEAALLYEEVEKSNSLTLLVDGITQAVELFHSHYKTENTVCVMLVQENEGNENDQLHIVRALCAKGIRLVRIPFSDAYECFNFAGDRCYYAKREVSLVYYRAGYDPNEYTPELWRLRKALENSRAIKLPDIKRTLLNLKIYQIELANKKEKSLNDYFTVFYDHIPDTSCVVKPMREGGGNNYFLKAGERIELKGNEIVSEFIEPTVHNLLLSGTKQRCVVELSTFGLTLHHNSKEIMNESTGYLVRIKREHDNEGCISRGTASLGFITLSE